jgi:hypothetical protein
MRLLSARQCVGLLLVAMISPLIVWAGSSSDPGWDPAVIGRHDAGPGSLDARTAWQIQLPAGATMQFSGYYLLDGRIYAIGTDGAVVAVRADTGEVAWIRKVVEEFDELGRPVAYRTKSREAILFARLDDVLILDPKTGLQLADMDVAEPLVTPVAVAAGRAFVFQPGGSLAACRLKDGYVFWRALFDGVVLLPPVYVPAANAVVAVDRTGMVAGLRNVDRAEHRTLFTQRLRSEPSGEPVVDGGMLYLSTRNQTLHAIDVVPSDHSQLPGQVVWQYRLAGEPLGSPMLTRNAIYQVMAGGGVQRIAKVPGEFRGWFDPNARQFLAEWPTGAVLLRADGTLALVADDPAKPVAVMNPGSFDNVISNSLNDAIFLTTRSGLLTCIRPSGAVPLQLASFMLPNSALPDLQESETAIDRLRRLAAEKVAKREGRKPAAEIATLTSQTQTTKPAVAPAPVETAARDPLKSQIPIPK